MQTSIVGFENGKNKSAFTHELVEIDPKEITIKQIDITEMERFQKNMSGFTWRPSPGRKLSFTVLHKGRVIGLINLSSPVITIGVRDEYLKLSHVPEERGHQLRCYYDISVCVGIQPLSWYWNIGKLLGMVAPTLGDFIEKNYKDDEYKGLTTTSLYGKSIQYDRVFKYLGLTKGYGHEHISDEEYTKMVKYLSRNNLDVPAGTTNMRMRRISAYAKATGEKISLEHGHRRGVYYHPAVPSEKRPEVILNWYKRWGLPRYSRKMNEHPPYETGLEESQRKRERWGEGKIEVTEVVESEDDIWTNEKYTK